ncbi:MAG TPA: hypothetical protein VMB82_00850, partial [Acidimicrobiales bacterium]|nr:hypothetical protein [Acidimicrobiales bacterium]
MSTRMAKVGVVIAMLTGLTSALVVALGAAPAFAADTTACSAPASGGTSDTFIEGTANSYTVTCYTETGVSGTSDYPASITIASGALPADASMPTTVAGGCTQATSGSGTTEEY